VVVESRKLFSCGRGETKEQFNCDSDAMPCTATTYILLIVTVNVRFPFAGMATMQMTADDIITFCWFKFGNYF
jgi:hypothetical protein